MEEEIFIIETNGETGLGILELITKTNPGRYKGSLLGAMTLLSDLYATERVLREFIYKTHKINPQLRKFIAIPRKD